MDGVCENFSGTERLEADAMGRDEFTYRAGKVPSHEMRCVDDEVVGHPSNGEARREMRGRSRSGPCSRSSWASHLQGRAVCDEGLLQRRSLCRTSQNTDSRFDRGRVGSKRMLGEGVQGREAGVDYGWS